MKRGKNTTSIACKTAGYYFNTMLVLSDSHRGRKIVDAGEASVSCDFILLASSDINK